MPADSIDHGLPVGPPAGTLRSPGSLGPPPQETARAIPEPSFRAHDDAAMPRATIRTVRETDAAQRSALRERRSNAKLRRRLWAAAIPMLSALLVGQVLFHFRDALAAYWPASKPALAVLCKATGCVIGPPRDISGVWIDASDLEAHPSHKGLLILSATVRSRANTALAYPDLVLTLTDTSDQIVARRSFAPSEYAIAPAAIANGIPPNGEVLVKLYIDASA